MSLDGTHAAPVQAPPGYRIAELNSQDLDQSPYDALRNCRDYLGDEAFVFGVFRADGVLVCAQCLWYGERYRRARFWPTESCDVVSMHLISLPSERGKGLATWLKKETAERMSHRGFVRLYSRVWWTNYASVRVNEKAGWQHMGTVCEVKLWGREKRLRVVRQLHRFPVFVDTFADPFEKQPIDVRT